LLFYNEERQQGHHGHHTLRPLVILIGAILESMFYMKTKRRSSRA